MVQYSFAIKMLYLAIRIHKSSILSVTTFALLPRITSSFEKILSVQWVKLVYRDGFIPAPIIITWLPSKSFKFSKIKSKNIFFSALRFGAYTFAITTSIPSPFRWMTKSLLRCLIIFTSQLNFLDIRIISPWLCIYVPSTYIIFPPHCFSHIGISCFVRCVSCRQIIS